MASDHGCAATTADFSPHVQQDVTIGTRTLPCSSVRVQRHRFVYGVLRPDGSQSCHPNVVFSTNGTLRVNASDGIGSRPADGADSAVLAVEQRMCLLIRHIGHESDPERSPAACHSIG